MPDGLIIRRTCLKRRLLGVRGRAYIGYSIEKKSESACDGRGGVSCLVPSEQVAALPLHLILAAVGVGSVIYGVSGRGRHVLPWTSDGSLDCCCGNNGDKLRPVPPGRYLARG